MSITPVVVPRSAEHLNIDLYLRLYGSHILLSNKTLEIKS